MNPAHLALLSLLLVAEGSAAPSGYIVQAPQAAAPSFQSVAADAVKAGASIVPAPGGPTLLVISRGDGCGWTLLPRAEAGAEIVAAIRPRARLEGRVATPEGAPVAGARIVTAPHHGDRFARRLLNILDRDEGRAARALFGPAEIAATDDGAFVLDGACAGEWSLRAHAPAWLPSEPVVVTVPAPPAADGGPAPPVRVVLPPGWSPAGRVVEKKGDLLVPVPGASVVGRPATGGRALSGREAVTTSGADGEFALHGFPPGHAELVVTAEGFAEQRWLREPGDATPLVMERLGTIRFTIRSPEGTAVPEVRAALLSLQEGRWLPDSDPVAIPLEGDAHHLRSIPPGRRGLVVHVAGHLPLTVDAFDVPAGGVADLGELAPRRSGHVAGRVLDAATEAPVKGATIRPDLKGMKASRKERSPLQVPEAVSGEDGTFRLEGLPAGTWLLGATAEGWADAPHLRQVVTIDADPAHEPEPLVFRLERPAEILIRVVDRQDRPIPRVRLWARADQQDWVVGDMVTDDAGEFVVTGVPPGTILVGRQDGRWEGPAGGRVIARPGARASIVLKETGTRVTGRAVAGGRAVPCRVAFGGSPNPRMSFSDTYELRDVPAGTHPVSVAWAMVREDGSFAEGQFTMRTFNLVVPDGVAELTHDFEVELSPVPRAEAATEKKAVVKGRLVDAETREPLPFSVRGERHGPELLGVPTDSSGAFTIELSAGQWKLNVDPPESKEWWFGDPATVIVSDGRVVMSEPDPVVVTARRSRIAHLRIVDENGAPVPGVECRPLVPPYADEHGTILGNYSPPAIGDALGFVIVRLESDAAVDLACVAPGRALAFVPDAVPSREGEPRLVPLPASGSLRIPASASETTSLVLSWGGRAWTLPLEGGAVLGSIMSPAGDDILFWGLPAGTWGVMRADGSRSEIIIEPGGVARIAAP